MLKVPQPDTQHTHTYIHGIDQGIAAVWLQLTVVLSMHRCCCRCYECDLI